MKSQFLILQILLVILLWAGMSSGEVLNVPYDYYSIKDALLHSSRNDQIHIAPGRYFEINLLVPPGVTLTGMGETPDQVIIDAQGLGRIMLCESLDETTIIQNITFTNGLANGNAVYDQCGGAILLNNSTIRLINCRFINNSAEGHGGALRCSHASPQIISCYFEGNKALDGGGGAIDFSYDSNPLLQNCFFRQNQANWGGALSCRGNSSPVVYNSNFDRNLADGDLGYGGAVIADFEALPSFEKCTFYGNQARYGGALACFETSQTNLTNCTIVANKSIFLGGGLVCSNSYPIIENSIIAFQDGSAIACGGSALPRIRCSNIFGNENGDWTGAIAAQLQVDNNISADPLFCSIDQDLDFRFTLQPESPCAEGNSACSTMGAWTTGCYVTPIETNGMYAAWVDCNVHITWQVDSPEAPMQFVLYRSRSSFPNESEPVRLINRDHSQFVALDQDVPAENGQELIYRLYLIQDDGSRILIDQTSLPDTRILNPLHLRGAHPNPFNPRTTISFETSKERRVKIMVHNIRGQKVKELADSQYHPGVHNLVWDGTDESGRRVESGTYFITVRSGETVRSKKVLLVK